MMETNTYLHLVLLPVAEVFRSRFPEGRAPMVTILNKKSCRVKFTSSRLDREWCDFCLENELKNDSSLEF